MRAGETEQSLPASTRRAISPNYPLEVASLGARVVLDSQLKRCHAASIALEQPEEVVVIGVAIGSDLLLGKCLQV
jgi:hypothetical protein